MSIRGTRVFPPAGIRGSQGNTGAQGESGYSLTSVSVLGEAVANNNEVEYIASLTPGTLKLFGNVNFTATNNCVLTLTPLIGGSSLPDFACVSNIAAGQSVCLCIVVDSAVTEGENFELRIGLTAGTGTITTSTLFYNVE